MALGKEFECHCARNCRDRRQETDHLESDRHVTCEECFLANANRYPLMYLGAQPRLANGEVGIWGHQLQLLRTEAKAGSAKAQTLAAAFEMYMRQWGWLGRW